jgi:hypothetical protein
MTGGWHVADIARTVAGLVHSYYRALPDYRSGNLCFPPRHQSPAYFQHGKHAKQKAGNFAQQICGAGFPAAGCPAVSETPGAPNQGRASAFFQR